MPMESWSSHSYSLLRTEAHASDGNVPAPHGLKVRVATLKCLKTAANDPKNKDFDYDEHSSVDLSRGNPKESVHVSKDEHPDGSSPEQRRVGASLCSARPR